MTQNQDEILAQVQNKIAAEQEIYSGNGHDPSLQPLDSIHLADVSPELVEWVWDQWTPERPGSSESGLFC